MSYKITVILPIFNAEKYIRRALDSILNQTFNKDEIEVIMVDDCSTDTTKDIIKEYEKKYGNFKAIFLKTNSEGASVPRNSGLEIASGKYIMFLDPDDEYAYDMCETLYDKIEESQVDIVKCNHEMVYPTFSRLDYMYNKNVGEIEIDCTLDLPPNKVSICNVIHKKQFLDENNIKFMNVKNAEDMLFFITEFLNTDKMIYLNNYHGYKYHFNNTVSHHMKPSKKNLDGTLSAWWETKKIIETKNRLDLLPYIFKKNIVPFFIRLMNYEGNKKRYIKKFYEFEKSLNIQLTFDYKWVNILNKLIMKKQFTFAVLYLNMMKFIRNSPLLKVYRKSL